MSSSIAPKPLKSPKHRYMCAGSVCVATRQPPIARATSPTTPCLSGIIVVQMLAGIKSNYYRSCASRSSFPSFSFSACHCRIIRRSILFSTVTKACIYVSSSHNTTASSQSEREASGGSLARKTASEIFHRARDMLKPPRAMKNFDACFSRQSSAACFAFASFGSPSGCPPIYHDNQ